MYYQYQYIQKGSIYFNLYCN